MEVKTYPVTVAPHVYEPPSVWVTSIIFQESILNERGNVIACY